MFVAGESGDTTDAPPLGGSTTYLAVCTPYGLINIVAIKIGIIAVHDLPTSLRGAGVEGSAWPERPNLD